MESTTDPIRKEDPIKILHFLPAMRLEDGGVVKAVLDLCTMAQDHHQVGLATFDDTGVPAAWKDPETQTTRVHLIEGTPNRGMKPNPQQLQQLEQLIKEYDVVHLHTMWTQANPQLVKLCTKLNTPYLLSVHGMLDDWCMSQRKLKKVLYMKTAARNLLRDAAVIHCTAQAELDQASAWFDPKKGRVVPLPFDLSEYENMPSDDLAYNAFDQLDRSKPKVLFLSRIHYKKGVDRLIKASAILQQQGVDHQLVIAGTGDEDYVKQMKELAVQEGAQAHTYFLGFASGQEKIALLGACETFALPTSQENFGFVFFESLAAGTFVVTTKGTDTWPEIESSQAGAIVDNTPEAFAQKLKEVLSDPETYNTRAQQGRAWAFKEMSMPSTQAKYTDLYRSIVADAKGSKR